MSTKIDISTALVNISVAFIEIQKDISQLRRNVESLYDQLQTVDQATAVKFKETDNNISTLFKQLYELKEGKNAANGERKEDNGVNEKDLREGESKESLLRNDK